MLAEDAAYYSDGGGKVTAVRKPIVGRARLARMLVMMTAPSAAAVVRSHESS
jgi:hypothetical protein